MLITTQIYKLLKIKGIIVITNFLEVVSTKITLK